MSQIFPVDSFKQQKATLKFNKNVIKNYDEDKNKGHII